LGRNSVPIGRPDVLHQDGGLAVSIVRRRDELRWVLPPLRVANVSGRKWPAVAEAWTDRDPQEGADALLGRSARLERRASSPAGQGGAAISGPPACTNRDRYYRQARRLHVLQAMKGNR